MKRVLTLLILTILIPLTYGQTPKDLSVQTWVETNEIEPSITLRWEKITTNVTSYDIFRKAKAATSWGSIIKSCSSSDTSWTDTNVSIGVTYEYRIQKMNGSSELGVSYILGGIKIPVTTSSW
jgi:hypothetical protein